MPLFYSAYRKVKEHEGGGVKLSHHERITGSAHSYKSQHCAEFCVWLMLNDRKRKEQRLKELFCILIALIGWLGVIVACSMPDPIHWHEHCDNAGHPGGNLDAV